MSSTSNHKIKAHTTDKYKNKGLTQQVRRSTAQDDSTGGAGLAAAEPDQFVLAHHDLVDQRALTCDESGVRYNDKIIFE